MTGAAASLIFGIAAFNFFQFFPFSIIILSLFAASFLLFRQNKTKVFIMILIFAFGFLYSSIRNTPLPNMHLPDEASVVKGVVIDVPEVSGEVLRLTISEVSINGKRLDGKVRLFLPEEAYKDKDYLLPAYGDTVIVSALLREPSPLRNPGVYSYDIKREGIMATGDVKSLKVTEKGRGFLAWIYKARQRLGGIIEKSLSEENASFQKAIILGFQRGIGQDMRDAFSATGLAHLLSISGTHFGMLAFIIFKLTKALVRSLPVKFLTRASLYITPTQAAVILTLPVLALYAVISGLSTPTVRSFIMVFIYMAALFIGRKGEWLNSLSIAAVIILLWNPGTLFELSFQLSFMAVLSLGYVIENRKQEQPVLPELENKDEKGLITKAVAQIKTGLLMATAAVLGTAPIAGLVFKQFPLLSPLTNLIVTPLICFIILPLGFFTGFAALFFNIPSMPLSPLTDAATHFSLRLIKLFSDIPYSSLHIPDPSFSIIALYYLSLFLIFKNRNKLRFLPLLLVICIYIIRPYISHDNFKVTFLDVGQGDAALVELPDDRVMLIDGGPEKSDSGRRVIAPHLWSKGIRSVDYLVATHPHPDHFGGFPYIMDNFKIGEIWLNGEVSPESEIFFEKVKESKIHYKVKRRGDLLEAGEYKVQVLHPYDDFFADSERGDFSNYNSGSLVIKVESANASILFTGDIEEEAEESLMPLGKWLKSDIIKVPHHGGRTSSSEGFIEAVSPQAAVISVGRYNSYSHPNPVTLERYKASGVRIYRTDIDGAVIVNLSDNGYSVQTYQDFTLKNVSSWKDETRNLGLLL
ncbi:MAG: DNA internalization-related competence protein ComEC/Rec2 [Nitrospirota bacterium]